MLWKGKRRLHKANMFLGIEEIVFFLKTINCYSAVYIKRMKKITKDNLLRNKIITENFIFVFVKKHI